MAFRREANAKISPSRHTTTEGAGVRKDEFAGRTKITEYRRSGVLNFLWIISTTESLVHFLH